jgi:hypothetical protein
VADPSTLLFGLVVLTVAGAERVLSALATRDVAKQSQKQWAEAARRLGGKFDAEKPALFRRPSLFISAVVEGVGVNIDSFTVSQGGSSKSYTRVSAPAEAPSDLTIQIYAEDVFSTLRKTLGMQDVVVGHREFDEVFVVKASDEDLARAWLVPGVADALSRHHSWEHRLDSGTMTSTCTGVVEDVDELVRAAQATALLAGRGAVLRAEWVRLAHALDGVLRGEPWYHPEPAIAVGGPASPVFVELGRGALPDEKRSDRLLTRVRAERGGVRREPFVAAGRDKLNDRHGTVVSTPNAARFEVRSSDAAVTATRFDEGLAQALDALAPDAVVGTESDVSVLFGGVMFDAERLQAAIAIARHLAAAEQSGPYR